MATRQRDTFKKRQRELLRIEKQRDKAARRLAKKAAHTPEDMTTTETPAEPASQDHHTT